MGVLGIDIGGSGIKANLVDVETGALLGERHKILTPKPATPQAVAEVVGQMVEHFGGDGPIGCAFPAIVQHGVTLSAANVDDSWVQCDAARLFSERVGRPVRVVNDADAAGIAEEKFGAGRGIDGVVIMLTFGTGIGSALFVDGKLVPNSELGHLQFRGFDAAEDYASARVRDEQSLKWSQWAVRARELLLHLQRLFTPDLLIIGGGLSRKWDKFADILCEGLTTQVVPAQLENQAGIVGAALATK